MISEWQIAKVFLINSSLPFHKIECQTGTFRTEFNFTKSLKIFCIPAHVILAHPVDIIHSAQDKRILSTLNSWSCVEPMMETDDNNVFENLVDEDVLWCCVVAVFKP